MADMTWREFKDAVDKQLKKEGIDESAAIIWYIDVSSRLWRHGIDVILDDEYGIAISA